jgi:DNA-binding transcriptional ArsR family regulator
MSNKSFTCRATRAAILSQLTAALARGVDLSIEKNLREAVPNNPMFDIVGTLHYTHHTTGLPDERLRKLVEVYKVYGALANMLAAALPAQFRSAYQVPTTLSTSVVSTTGLTFAGSVQTAIPPVQLQLQASPDGSTFTDITGQAAATRPSRSRAKVRAYGRLNIYEMVSLLRDKPSRTISQLVRALGVSGTTIRRGLYALKHYGVAKDITANRRLVADIVPESESERISRNVYKLDPATFEESYERYRSQAAAEHEDTQPADTPDAPDTIVQMIVKAASAGDGDAAVKLAEAARLMQKYG